MGVVLSRAARLALQLLLGAVLLLRAAQLALQLLLGAALLQGEVGVVRLVYQPLPPSWFRRFLRCSGM